MIERRTVPIVSATDAVAILFNMNLLEFIDIHVEKWKYVNFCRILEQLQGIWKQMHKTFEQTLDKIDGQLRKMQKINKMREIAWNRGNLKELYGHVNGINEKLYEKLFWESPQSLKITLNR